MSASQTNLETAKNFYGRLAAGDMEGFFETLDEGVVAKSPGSAAHIPWAGEWHGKDGFGAMMTKLSELAVIELYDIDRFVADGDERVVVFGREHLRVRATERLAETAWVHELTFRAGRVVRFVEHYDTDALAVAFAG